MAVIEEWAFHREAEKNAITHLHFETHSVTHLSPKSTSLARYRGQLVYFQLSESGIITQS